MEEFRIGKNEDVVMKLLHFFITEKGYTPIILHGVQDEIWLENLENNYEVVRIVTEYIHNDEQFEFDIYKTKQILKRIKRKTLSLKLNTLSLFTNLGNSVHISNCNDKTISCAKVEQVKDLDNYSFIKEEFPTIMENTDFKEEGFNLFMRIAEDINKANQKEAYRAEKVFAKKKPTITYAIILINIIVFLLMYILGNGSTDNVTLVNFGALVPALVRNGEYYRLLTAGFVHIGALHLLCNMYCLYVIGSQLESFFGKTKYLIIYLFSILTASLLSLAFNMSDGYVISAGASGAIFGLFGSLLYFGYHYRLYLGSVLQSQIIPLIILNLLLSLAVPSIDLAAHVGGLIGGALISLSMGVKYKETRFEQLNGWIVTIIFVVFLIFLAFKGI